MAKRVNTAILDKALDIFKTGASGLGPCNRLAVCTTEPTTYAEANATYMLALVTVTGTDFTLANGDGAGTTPRKVTVGAKTGTVISTSGTATHVALIDTANSVLLEVTTCTSQALTANGSNTVNTPSFKIEIGAPT